MTTRRSFLRNALAAVCAAPLLVRAAFAAKPDSIYGPTKVIGDWGRPVCEPAAIKVPSNRVLVVDHDRVLRDGMGDWAYVPRYVGDWDGTFKLEPCTNPAYILADLLERDGHEPNWQELYRWGRFCDEPVIDWNGGSPQIDPPKWERRLTVDTTAWQSSESNLKRLLQTFCDGFACGGRMLSS